MPDVLLEKSIVGSDQPIRDVIAKIDAHSLQIALVQNEGKLIGTVTDGDIRRAILADIPLDAPVHRIMHTTPTTVPVGTTDKEARQIMREKRIHQLPVIDDQGVLKGLKVLDTLYRPGEDNWVVLMAGGLGTRLLPLTETCPKPLLKVGGKPIMETIIERLVRQGFRKIVITLNYKGEMISDYFGDGSDWGAEIRYVHENEPLGTAGALSLIQEKPTQPFFVMNGDLLTKIKFDHILKFHQEHNSSATMCVREYRFTVPYGVAKTDGHRLTKINEKPVQKFLVNGGIYLLDPVALDYVKPHTPLDMPQLLQMMMDDDLEPSVFPMREYWIDIGQLKDFEKAQDEFHTIFNDELDAQAG